MKLSVDSQKISEVWQSTTRILPVIALSIIVVTFLFLTYFVLVPRDDTSAINEGQQKINSLSITFNKKLLTELNSAKSSAQPVPGRNPFAN